MGLSNYGAYGGSLNSLASLGALSTPSASDYLMPYLQQQQQQQQLLASPMWGALGGYNAMPALGAYDALSSPSIGGGGGGGMNLLSPPVPQSLNSLGAMQLNNAAALTNDGNVPRRPMYKAYLSRSSSRQQAPPSTNDFLAGSSRSMGGARAYSPLSSNCGLLRMSPCETAAKRRRGGGAGTNWEMTQDIAH